MTFSKEINKRRTIAIISHPDAGKTTLTEKLLLYGGALQHAGMGKQSKTQQTTSDWMDLERQRGISVTSTVLQFDYRDCCINLLDTPGHRDFSEDTYRVLMAVDAVVMVIDAAKGIEAQTRKLFEICRMRGIPIFTFMNKLDRPSRSPLDLLDELESILKINVCAVNWPMGDGKDFKGVYDRQANQAHFFERTDHGAYRAPVAMHSVTDPEVKERLPLGAYEDLVDAIELIDEIGEPFDLERINAGELSPVYFGSAVNNFGVQLLLDAVIEHAPAPQPRKTTNGLIDPNHKAFSGFIFKIQSNMDPNHRDQIAFMRICSGRFERDMRAIHSRTGSQIRLSSSQRVFAKERTTVDVAYAGDVIGLVGHSGFGIGDTLTEDATIQYDEMPQFAPEHFVSLHNPNPSAYKRFKAGTTHLLQEGALQAFYFPESGQSAPLLGAVGRLQFDVFKHRMESEYGSVVRMEPAPYSQVRWIDTSEDAPEITPDMLPTGCRLAVDLKGGPVIMFNSEWAVKYFCDRNPDARLITLPGQEELA